MNLNNIQNYENTMFENDDFPFGCFSINNSNTIPHWHNHIEIVYIHKGTCSVYINGVIFSCSEGDIIHIPPKSLHSILPKSCCHYYAIVIGDTLLMPMMTDFDCKKTLYPFLSSNRVSPVYIKNSHIYYMEVISIIKSIINEATTKKGHWEILIKLELIKFFTILIRLFSTQIQINTNVSIDNSQTIKKAIQYVSKHYKEKITIIDMSNYTNISEQHFCRLFKAYTGKTFIEFLTTLRLEHANILLTKTKLPITQIPEMTGFCNANYFSRVYKKRYGHAPSYTRKN